MKTFSFLAPLLLSAICASAFAATDHGYYVTEVTAQQKFDVYNDGHNTYLQSIPGLVVTGATADGEYFIVRGLPTTIRGFMNGKPITVVRGLPPATKPQTLDSTAIQDRLNKLTEQLAAASDKAAQAKRGVPATEGSKVAAPTPPTATPSATGVPKATTAPAVGPVGASAQVAAGTQPAGGTAGVTATPAKSFTAATIATYAVQPQDQNLRLLIDRWSQLVGWNAVWDVDRDIPIERGDAPVGDFKTVVRYVLAATELGDVQLKPCFYSNKVIRVVRKTMKCNPSE